MNYKDFEKVTTWIANNPDHELVRKLEGNESWGDYWARVRDIFDFVDKHGPGKVVEIDWSKNV